jgi:peptidyl-prolyl cis-trans isomerase SurA
MQRRLAVAIIALAVGTVRGDVVDRVMAVVNGAILTQSDVYGAIAFGLVSPAGDGDPLRSGLEQLIERELVLAEVNRYSPPEPSEQDVEAQAARIRARFPSADGFRRALDANGYTEERIRSAARDSIRIQAYLDQRFSASLQPTERAAVVAQWKEGLRRRAEITIQYQPAGK